MNQLLILIPGLPLLGFLVLSLAGRPLSKPVIAWIGAGVICMSAVLTIILAVQFFQSSSANPVYQVMLWQWMKVGSFSCSFSLRVDALTLAFLFIITFVGALIHIYSTAFMKQDRDYARFFASMNLFVCAMLLLVMADNLVLLYLGWEGVGLCSYLLIGFWYENPANCNAARKAFIVTRVGDTAMAIGLFLLFRELGTLNIPDILSQSPAYFEAGSSNINWIALLLLARGHGEIRAASLTNMATRCDGRAFSGQRPDTCSHHGNGRGVPDSQDACGFSTFSCSHGSHCHCRRCHFVGCRLQCHGTDRYQTGSGLFHHQPDWIHVPGTWRGSLERRDISFLHSRILQSPPLPCGGSRD